jgi:LuxR family transcriptional activator of conjugal transfer of Ti plasmids
MALLDASSTLTRDPGGLTAEAMQVIGEARDPLALYAYIGTLCVRLGFPYFSFFVSDPLHPGEGAAVDPMTATTYPEPWRAHYRSRGFQHHDPVLKSGSLARRPFIWGDPDFTDGLRGTSRQIIEDAHTFGIQRGLSVPVYGPRGDSGVFTVASPDAGSAFTDAVHDSLPALHLVAHQLHAAVIERLLPGPIADDVRLTEQEKTCLLWTLRGKTSWEIATIIGRSTPAVNFHLQKVLRKLGTSSKSQAALIALRAGLI